MKITRSQGIKVLVGLFAGFLNELRAQSMVTISAGSKNLAELSFGDLVQKTDAERAIEQDDYKRCIKQQSANPPASAYTFCVDPNNKFGYSEYVPGTAKMKINLDGWRGFELTLGDKTVFIGREELFASFSSN